MTTNETHLHAELLRERVTYLGPPLRSPVLLRLARPDDDRRDRPADRTNEIPLPLALVRPRTKIPLYRLGRNSESREKLEILILNVLDGMRRNLSIRKEPVQVARASAIEAEFNRSARGAGDDPRFEINLEVDHEVETPLRQLRRDIRERRQAPRAIEDDYLVDRSVAAHQCSRTRLEHPRDPRPGIRPLERVDHRQHVDRVTDGAHHHDADLVWYPGRHCCAHSTLFRRRYSSSSAEQG